jgi:hypothetical protein
MFFKGCNVIVLASGTLILILEKVVLLIRNNQQKRFQALLVMLFRHEYLKILF